MSSINSISDQLEHGKHLGHLEGLRALETDLHNIQADLAQLGSIEAEQDAERQNDRRLHIRESLDRLVLNVAQIRTSMGDLDATEDRDHAQRLLERLDDMEEMDRLRSDVDKAAREILALMNKC